MKTPDRTLKYYCALFIDVLGMKQPLGELHQLGIPQTPEEEEKASELLKKTVGVVESLRSGFAKLFEEAAKASSSDKSSVPGLHQVIADELQRNIQYRYFSDSIIITVPLPHEHGTRGAPLTCISFSLLAICGLHLRTLGSDACFRGGVEIGVGVELENGEIFGSAVSEAYCLESQSAKYPRIVAGERFREYLQDIAQGTSHRKQDIINIALAKLCLELIRVDEDGLYFLDFLGDAVRKTFRTTLGPKEFDEAFESVVHRLQHWRDNGNEKLADRYDRLRRYMEKNRATWSA